MTITIELLWAIAGLLLTIAATFLPASFASPVWIWEQQEVKTFSLEVTYQVGAVFFVGCLGGKNAAVISQIAYIFLGLTLLPVFTHGGGIDYFREPSFGYLLGFILSKHVDSVSLLKVVILLRPDSLLLNTDHI